jgi:carboxypeptidase C (cathepsin A)
MRAPAALLTAALTIALTAALAAAQPTAEPPTEPPPTQSPPAPEVRAPRVKEHLAVTHHEIVVQGQPLRYTATAGYMELPDYDGKHKADFFYIAYTLDTDDRADRPLTFSFNGGPGSSSVWLHMGVLGPRRVVMDDEGFPLPPPYRLTDNEHTWLPFTDMVFIDPVSTGYSRPVEGENRRQFHGLDEDIQWVGDFIRLYVTRNHRWPSPKLLIGESYGTTRAAGLSGYLQNTHGMYLNGIILVSPILNFQTARFDVGNDLPYWLFLPTYTATAWYHNRLEPDLQRDLHETLREVERFARTEYLLALARGGALSDAQRRDTARKLARYTGTSEDFMLRANLRPRIFNFTKELLRDQGRTVGRLDSRFTGIDRDGVGASPDFDPSMAAILGPYTATLYDYVRTELNYENDLVYEILTGRVRPWSYAGHQNRYVNVAETLRDAMTRNRDLKVWYAAGYYDLANPYFAMDYTADHLGLDPELRGNIHATYYEAGHMMYIRLADLEQMTRDAIDWYAHVLD